MSKHAGKGERDPKTFKKEFFNKNWNLKLLSLGLAVLLWFFVSADFSVSNSSNNAISGDSVSQKSFTVPVEAEGLADGMILSEELPAVDLVVQGAQNTINNLQTADLVVTADFSEAVEGTNEIKLDFSLPKKVQLVSSSRQTLTVTLESHISRTFTIQPVISGELAEGYICTATSIEPESITVTGLRSSVEAITAVQVNLNFSGEKTDVEQTLTPVIITNDSLREQDSNWELSEQSVLVKATVTADSAATEKDAADADKNEQTNENNSTSNGDAVTDEEELSSKTVPIEVAVSGEAAAGYTVQSIAVEPVEITISGTKAALADISYISTESIDISGSNQDISRSVLLLLPDGITGDTSQVNLTVVIVPTE